MVHINKTQFPSALRQQGWQTLWKVTKRAQSPEALEKNLRLFLSLPEISMLEKRLAVLLLLEKGMTYREIGRTIDVTRSTISFVKHHFVKKPVVHRQYSKDSGKHFSQRHRSSKGAGEFWKD